MRELFRDVPVSINKVYIIGISPGGASSLNPEALALIQDAEVLFGGQRLLEIFPDVRSRKVRIGADLAEIAALISAGIGLKRMVVLASGDPDFFGIARTLVRQLGPESVEIIPNVSSMQLAFARIKENWDDCCFCQCACPPVGRSGRKGKLSPQSVHPDRR